MSADKRQVTQIEMEMMVDQIKVGVPAILLLNEQHAIILWDKFNKLKDQGFTEQQALHIISTRPVIDA